MSSLFFGSIARFRRQTAAVRITASCDTREGDNKPMMRGKPLLVRTAARR